MERAIGDLCQLPDRALFEEVATGIGYVVDLVNRLNAAAHSLAEAGDYYPAKVLGNLAEEEAAKVLILTDAIRCPPCKSAARSRTLGYFYDHLAKGIYAEVCGWFPVDFAEIARLVEHERDEYYLDGPNGVDWICYNSIIQRREDALYVGYVRDEGGDGEQGERYWVRPRSDTEDELCRFELFRYSTPPAVDIARALQEVGVTTPAGLAVVANLWRPVDVHPEMRFDELERLNLRTLEELDARGLLAEGPNEIYAHVRDRWPFPLWPLDLGKRRVKKDDLRKAGGRWTSYA